MSPKFALSVLAAALLAIPLQASAVNQQEIFEQFNVVTLGNMKSTSHVDGRTYVTGSLTGSGAVLGMHPQDIRASDYAAVTVRGQGVTAGEAALSGSIVTDNGAVVYGNVVNSEVQKGHSAIYGDSTSTNYVGSGSVYIQGKTSGGNVNVTTLGSVQPGSVQAVNSAAATSTDMGKVLTNLSTAMKSYAPSGGSVDIVGNRATFNAKVNSQGTAVFDLTSVQDDLFNAGNVSEFTFNFNGATTVYMNSSLTSAHINENFLGGSALGASKNVIWNFYKATDIVVDAQFGGSILAVNANLINNANIEGGVYVNNLDSRAEIHINQFIGAVPEPETYAMLMAGLGLVGFMARRRKRAK